MRPVLELERGKRPLFIDCGQYCCSTFGVSLQNLLIMIGTVFLANQDTHRPIAHRNETGHLIPGVVDKAIGVRCFLPIIDLVPWNTCLEYKIGVAPNGIERIVLYCP